MNITVENSNKKISFREIRIIKMMIRSFMGMWGITQNINITVELDHEDNKLWGGVCYINKNTFIIVINKKDLSSYSKDTESYMLALSKTLAHECTHIKQYYNQELTGKKRLKWKNKYIRTRKYKELPHEKEAFKYQDKMVDIFFKEIKYSQTLYSN